MVRVAGWERFAWLRAGFSTRVGGSSSVYGGLGELNLGWTAEDDAAVVAANRRRFVDSVAGESGVELVTVRQVHGAEVRLVERGRGALETAEGRAVLEGDGLMTWEVGMLIGVQTADCVPVLLADTRTRAVAAIHAGWRGTLAGIVGEGVRGMVEAFGSRPEDLVAAIGPAIGPCCFDVGEEVREEFDGRYAFAADLFSARADGKLKMDLWEANRRQLVEAGVPTEAISMVGDCTACARVQGGGRKYFSHRAERGRTGRMMSVVGVSVGGRGRG